MRLSPKAIVHGDSGVLTLFNSPKDVCKIDKSIKHDIQLIVSGCQASKNLKSANSPSILLNFLYTSPS